MSAPDPGLNPEAGKKLNEYLLELRLPAIRRTFGEKARRAESETLSYEQYLSALGQELIRAGRRVAFTTCVRLVQDLLLAKKELRLNRAIRKLAYYEALVIDDLGYVQQSR